MPGQVISRVSGKGGFSTQVSWPMVLMGGVRRISHIQPWDHCGKKRAQESG